MKLNLNTHDIYALVLCFQSLVGARVINVYDINPHTICLKMNDNSGNKKYLLIESSAKFYLLNEFHAVNNFPSSFSMKLRKHLCNKRIDKFEQINSDRVIDIKFGIDDHAFHLVCEFYASGNIILTDDKYSILTLIHPYTYTDNDEKKKIRVNVGNVYPVDYATMNIDLTLENCRKIIGDTFEKITTKTKLKQFCNKLQLVMFGLPVVEHSILGSGIDTNQKIDNSTNIFSIFSDDKINTIIENIKNMYSLNSVTGYIVGDSVYPYLYRQYQSEQFVEYDSFSDAVTVHFGKVDKFETKEKKIETKAEEKITKHEKMLTNIKNQISGFDNSIQKNSTLIENIECDMEVLQQFLDDVYGKYENIILLEYTEHLKKVKFNYKNITYEWNTGISAHANLNNTFKNNKLINDKRKKAETALKKSAKIVKTENSVETAIVSIKERTKENWFEKFNWFFTSGGLLFVSGKTADQNETLVKYHMEKNDMYFHSDVAGSGSGILKVRGQVSPMDVEQCGCFLVSHTNSWKEPSNYGDKSYWVSSEQVSKTTETGEYVAHGSFIIRGHKNYISSQKFELGFGILFKTTDKDEFQTTCDINIEYALPILSVYSSMSEYKFKVKVTQGTQKIGKAIAEVLSAFSKKGNSYEKAGIKKISNDEIQRVLINRVKFHL